MASSDIYVAKESFATELDGQSVIVQKDVTRVRAGHPLLKGRENLFELLSVQYDVEQATSKPGEQRGAPTAAERRETKAAEVKAESEVVIEAEAEASEE